MDELVKSLRDIGILKSNCLINAFLAIDRKDFVPNELKEAAYLDEALPIGWGQTISQPYTVAFMLELLGPQPGDVILDIGSGSGWQTAILAFIISNHRGSTPVVIGVEPRYGKIHAIEIIPELCELGKKNVSKYNFVKKSVVKFHCGNGSEPAVGDGEADKIIAAASIFCDEHDKSMCLPENWKRQLKIGGVIVTPIGNSIWKFIKKSETVFESEEHPGFVFVPYV